MPSSVVGERVGGMLKIGFGSAVNMILDTYRS